jgi:hypothetical protein
MEPAPIDDHHDLFPGFPEGGHDLMNILAKRLRINMRDDFIEDFEVPYWTAPMTLSNTPLGRRLHERYGNHAWRLRLSSRLIWLWLSGRVGRRVRWAFRHQPARGRAKRHRMVSFS